MPTDSLTAQQRVQRLAQDMASYVHHSGYPCYDGGHSEPEEACQHPDCMAVREAKQPCSTTLTAQIEGLIAEMQEKIAQHPDLHEGPSWLKRWASQLAALLPAICEMEAENARLEEKP